MLCFCPMTNVENQSGAPDVFFLMTVVQGLFFVRRKVLTEFVPWFLKFLLLVNAALFFSGLLCGWALWKCSFPNHLCLSQLPVHQEVERQ